MSATTTENSPGRDLSPWLWLGVPPLLVLMQIGAKLISKDFFMHVMMSEQGVVENGTVVVLLLATVVGIVAHSRVGRLGPGHGLLRAWLLFFSLGCFVFAGEEASWGQHWFHWSTPETWAAFNPRGETSIHNASGLYDQLPRTILTAAALIGGLLLPVVQLVAGPRRRLRPSGRFYWFVPTIVCAPTVVLAMVVTLPKKYYEGYRGYDVPDLLAFSPGETKELLLGLFLLLYVASILRRLKQADPAAAEAAQRA